MVESPRKLLSLRHPLDPMPRLTESVADALGFVRKVEDDKETLKMLDEEAQFDSTEGLAVLLRDGFEVQADAAVEKADALMKDRQRASEVEWKKWVSTAFARSRTCA